MLKNCLLWFTGAGLKSFDALSCAFYIYDFPFLLVEVVFMLYPIVLGYYNVELALTELIFTGAPYSKNSGAFGPLLPLVFF